MAVDLQGSLDVFVTQPFGDQQGGKAFLNQKRGVTVPQIVDPNTMYS